MSADRTPPERKVPPLYDAELADLPSDLRWREWMGRVEAAVFAAKEPLPREALARLVGQDCRLDDLIGDIRAELKARPYDLVFVAGGWTHRTRPRFAESIRTAGRMRAATQPDLSKTETMVLTVVGYFQPVTRAMVSQMLGREISRDTMARLKRLALIGAGPRMAQPGAPLTYVTTPTFLSVFGLATLRDLPEMEEVERIQDDAFQL